MVEGRSVMGATEFTYRRRDGQEFDSSHTLTRRQTNRPGPARPKLSLTTGPLHRTDGGSKVVSYTCS